MKKENLRNKSGYLFEKKVKEKLEGLGLNYKAQGRVGTTPFLKRRTADFVVFLPNKTLVIECKRQVASGTAEEKIVFTLTSLKEVHDEFQNVETILVMEGGGWSKGCIQWVKEHHHEFDTKLMSVNQLLDYLETVSNE